MKNRLPHKIDFKAVSPCNGHVDSVGVKNQKESQTFFHHNFEVIFLQKIQLEQIAPRAVNETGQNWLILFEVYVGVLNRVGNTDNLISRGKPASIKSW